MSSPAGFDEVLDPEARLLQLQLVQLLLTIHVGEPPEVAAVGQRWVTVEVDWLIKDGRQIGWRIRRALGTRTGDAPLDGTDASRTVLPTGAYHGPPT